MRFPRSSGILMPVFSLPGGAGIGDFGDGAYEFVDFLHSASQSLWQILPLGPTARGNSPYSSYSAFATNPLLISCEQLVGDGLLSEQQLTAAEYSTVHSARVDYSLARAIKKPLLQAAFEKFQDEPQHALREAFDKFCEQNQSWLNDFVLFEAIACYINEPDWTKWDHDLANRNKSALRRVEDQLQTSIARSKFEQFLCDLQWKRLKNYANEKHVRIYGDMPIFVAFESADVWSHQDLFQLDECGQPTVVAGVPPDYFSATGQMWGNPLYDWDRLAETDYAWWVRRLKQAFEVFDVLRLDHFRGFESYWEIPAGAKDATAGHWKPSPGDDLFARIKSELGDVPIVAEDLGLITDEVHALRDRLGFPGMRVLQFGYDLEHDAYHRPESFPEHSVAYTGTHDNNTLVGWYEHRCESGIDNSLLDPFLQNGPDGLCHEMTVQLFHSAADTIIVPVQDLLALNGDSRMNTPGQPEDNWIWRCPKNTLTDSLATQLAELTTLSRRCPGNVC